MKKLTKEKYKGLLADPSKWNAGDFITLEYYDKWKEYFQTQGNLDASPLYYSKTEDFVSAYVIENSLESYDLFMKSGNSVQSTMRSFLYLSMEIAFLKRFSEAQTNKTALQTLTQSFIISANQDLLDSIRNQLQNSEYKIDVYSNGSGGLTLSGWLDGVSKVSGDEKELFFSYVDKASTKVYESDATMLSYIKEHISDIQKYFI